MFKKYASLFFGLLIVNFCVVGQHIDLSKINTEGFQHSQVKKIITDLTDDFGPRLTGTRQYYNAAQWAKNSLESWGLDKVYFEPYCDDCLGWDVNSFNVEMTAPSYMKIEAYPYAWTESSNGVQETEIVYVGSIADLERVKKDWQGKLKGKAVLIGSEPERLTDKNSGKKMLFDPLSTRFTDEELSKAESSVLPNPENALSGYTAGGKSLPEMLVYFDQFLGADRQFFALLKAEGVVGAFGTTSLYPGILHPSGTYNHKQSQEQGIPYFAISVEDFGKLSRLIEKDISPKIRFELNSELYLEPKNNVNIIGEITGSDPKLKNEVVMIGAHFDSWHSSSGATDNGAGSAVMMEVMRILKSSGVKPKRTIRIGLWGGEEQGYLGSLAYAKNHFGDLEDKNFKKEAEQVSVYLNMDNGAGMMKGIYLQGNESVRGLFAEFLKPYAHLDVDHLTIESTNFTDHDVFDHYNIPAFQIIQDKLNYDSVTHHTNLDVLEYVPEKDLMINATVLAGLVYQISMRDTPIPRKK